MTTTLFLFFFFFTDAHTPEIYTRPYTLSLHDALPIADAREGLDQLTRDRVDLACVDRERTAEVLRVERRVEPGTPPENEKVRERVAAETIRAVHPARDLARREEPGHRGGRGVGVDADPAHHVVAGRTVLL